MNRVLVTGANGNLGRKLIASLLANSAEASIVALDRVAPQDGWPSDPRVRWTVGDLRDPTGSWRDALRGIDAAVHFAAQNPYPEASWGDAAVSIDITLNMVAAAAAQGVSRFVFASSNHVMGGYKETPLAPAAGALTPALEPWPGTRSIIDGVLHDRPAYAVAKLLGERALAAAAATSALTAVSLRIGWCQPGANDPGTISAAGTPLAGAPDAAMEHDLRWFRQMWLSNRDFCGVVAAALTADATRWPTPAIVVNAMSANAGMPWDLDPTTALLGYRPLDDVWQALGLSRR